MANNKAVEIISEDTIQCFLFLTTPNSHNLNELCASVNNTVQNLSAGYIWHKDEFKFSVPINNTSDLPDHLNSVTGFGDNIEDEWFIVYLMLEVTKQHSNLVGQIYDNDGEFLLIESADTLPSWANPDTTENRVFIYRNHIHLVPPTIADTNKELEIKDAIKLISDMPEKTLSHEIQLAVLKRLGDYPKKIDENIHRGLVHLPKDIAALLTIEPSLISAIVNAYCHHDAIDAKALKNVKFDNCVTIQVKFTKCLYAMLMHSKLVKNVKHVRINENDKKSALGLKIACGYEIIMNNVTQDVFSSKEFAKFTESLRKNGYFKDNIEGSVNYKQSLKQAKEFFLSIECPRNVQVCNSITRIKQTKEFTDLKESMKNSQMAIQEDSDEWLNIHPEQLNDLLNSRYGKQSKFKNDDILNSQTITSELSNFLKQTSDFEGIDTTKAEDSEDNNIEFDSEEFISTLNNMMKYLTTGNENILNCNLSDDMEDDFTEDDELDEELKVSLGVDKQSEQNSNETVVFNMIQSIKEEEGSSGPGSNIMRTIGINKTDLLDSDDDEG